MEKACNSLLNKSPDSVKTPGEEKEELHNELRE
jgi:hypothetical protein